MQIDYTTIAISGLVAAVFGSLAVILQKWSEKPPRPFLVKEGSVIGEFMITYCKETKTDIEAVCLVAHEIDEDTTVFHIKSIDLFPEIWLGSMNE